MLLRNAFLLMLAALGFCAGFARAGLSPEETAIARPSTGGYLLPLRYSSAR